MGEEERYPRIKALLAVALTISRMTWLKLVPSGRRPRIFGKSSGGRSTAAFYTEKDGPVGGYGSNTCLIFSRRTGMPEDFWWIRI